MARQDKKTEILKRRFGKKNSIIVYPNEVPKFEYRVRISPMITKNTEYTIDVDYDVKQMDASVDYKIEFSTDLPDVGKLIIRLNGVFGRSEVYKFSRYTEPIDREANELLFSFCSRDCGQVSYLYCNIKFMVNNILSWVEYRYLIFFIVIVSLAYFPWTTTMPFKES